MTDVQKQPTGAPVQPESDDKSQANASTVNVSVQGNVQKKVTGLGIAGLVLGIIAIISSFVPLINILTFPFVILAVIFGGIGIAQTAKGKKSGRGIAIAALVLGIVALIITMVMYGTAGGNSETVTQDTVVVEEANGSSSANSAASTESSASTSAASDAAAAGDTYQQATDSDYAVTIDSCKQTKDYQGKAAVVITYTWTNNSDKATSFMVAITDKAFQDGVQLDTAILGNGDSSNLMKDVKPGKSLQVTQAFLLDSKTEPVTIECSELISFNDALLAKKTFNLK